MAIPIPTFQPHNYGKFRCIGSDCEDSCCEGMGVPIDRETFHKYQSSTDPSFAPLFEKHFALNQSSPSDSAYGLIVMNDHACPFLSAQKLCSLHQKYGEEFLSRACAIFPRSITVVDGEAELSLYMSCPEAVRTLLLDREPMQFIRCGQQEMSRLSAFPVVDTKMSGRPGEPYTHLHSIRAFIISVLQDRSYAIWERVTILGLFCEQLEEMVDAGKDGELPDLIASFDEAIKTRMMDDALAAVTKQSALQIDFALQAVDHRIKKYYTPPRFTDCYFEFVRGIGYVDDVTVAESAITYDQAYDTYYAPFMGDHAHILENYLVAYVFRSLFPLGPQESLYKSTGTIHLEYVKLVVHYALIRTIMVGMAGYHKEQFGVDHVVKAIQSFGKAVEHNLKFLADITKTLEDSGMTYMAMLAALIKG